jgi:chromosome partitioning protein
MLLALAGQKGGTGKSTTAIAIAAELAARGRKVLVADADPQGSLRTWAAVAAEAGHDCPTVVGVGADMWKPAQLPTLAKNFEDVVIDCPPRLDKVERAALMFADVVVLPCGPSAMEAWALAESVALVKEAQEFREQRGSSPLRAAVVITRKIARTTIGQGAREVLSSAGLPVLESELGMRIAFQEAPAAGLGVAQYAPSDPAADEVRHLVDELLSLAGTRKT